MSWYLANEDGVVGQFASGGGMVDLAAAVRKWGNPALKYLFEHGVSSSPLNCVLGLEDVAKHATGDVKETAQGLAKMLEGERLVSITQGFETHPKAKVSESAKPLSHPTHARLIKPIVRKVRKLLSDYFERQGAAIEAAVKPWLKLHMHEAEDAAEQKAGDILPDTVVPLSYPVTGAEEASYQALIAEAIRKAEAQLESELGSGATLPDTALTDYLRANSLEKLTGDFAETTKQRLRNAIAEAVQSGGTADDIVDAIQDEVEQFSTVRANMIAQTEVNNAYNAGRGMLATAAGFTEKAWITESGNPCPTCIANELQGWIPIDDDFESGDDAPTAHPMCYCSLDYRKVN